MDDSPRDNFNNHGNMGELSLPDGTGESGDLGCGGVIELQLRFDGERIVATGFTASGSRAVIEAGDILSAALEGKGWREGAALSAAWLESSLRDRMAAVRNDGGGHDDASLAAAANAAGFAIDALHGALEDSFRRGRFPQAGVTRSDTVLVAMSGGVDSSAACLLERDRGRNVVGVTMRLWSDPECAADGSQSCCSPAAIRDARAVCHSLGIPHLTIDYRDQFLDVVVGDFVESYAAGWTPNPCARCNGSFRFPELERLAGLLGAGRIATGHYANVCAVDGRRFISRGADAAKDQSYMLWDVESTILDRIDFPLGGMEKSVTRRMAREAGLPVHDRPESQEVCFIPDNDYRRFLRSQVATVFGEGMIVDTSGSPVGLHTGYMDYTIGQRHGLGVSAPEPLYVISTDPEQNQVVVGGREELAVRILAIGQVNCFVSARELVGRKLQIQARYNSQPVDGRLAETGCDGWTLHLEDAVYGVAKGQSAVIYLDGNVVAGGIITGSARSSRTV